VRNLIEHTITSKPFAHQSNPLVVTLYSDEEFGDCGSLAEE